MCSLDVVKKEVTSALSLVRRCTSEDEISPQELWSLSAVKFSGVQRCGQARVSPLRGDQVTVSCIPVRTREAQQGAPLGFGVGVPTCGDTVQTYLSGELEDCQF